MRRGGKFCCSGYLTALTVCKTKLFSFAVIHRNKKCTRKSVVCGLREVQVRQEHNK
jgi:hypothetical protein